MMRWVIALALAAVVASVNVPGVHHSKEYGLTLLATPYGWRPKQCVHSWPSGAEVLEVKGENRTEVTLPNGEVVHLPRLQECMKWDYEVPSVPSTFQNRANPGPAISDGWLDNAEYYTDRTDKTEFVHSLNGTYTIPNTPKENGAVIFYFLGTQNNDGSGTIGLSILQPVLTYGNGGQYFWFMESWNCCPNGQTHNSNLIKGFGPGDKVLGNIYEKGGEGGDWDIVSTYGREVTTLQVKDAGRTFDWIDATLETYSVGSKCDRLPTGVMKYTKTELYDTNSKGDVFHRVPSWKADHGGTSGCDGVLTIVSSTEIHIQHNG